MNRCTPLPCATMKSSDRQPDARSTGTSRKGDSPKSRCSPHAIQHHRLLTANLLRLIAREQRHPHVPQRHAGPPRHLEAPLRQLAPRGPVRVVRQAPGTGEHVTLAGDLDQVSHLRFPFFCERTSASALRNDASTCPSTSCRMIPKEYNLSLDGRGKRFTRSQNRRDAAPAYFRSSFFTAVSPAERGAGSGAPGRAATPEQT